MNGSVVVDPLFGIEILYAAERGHRPWNVARRDCPFCPGNERLLPEVLYERPAADGRPWATRSAPNKYPLVRPSAEDAPSGEHEVIIETPEHDRDLPVMSDGEMRDVAETYCARFRALAERHRAVVLFRNGGALAGRSLPHPHAQIVGLDRIPASLAAMADRLLAHHGRTERCLVCDLVAKELRSGERLVAEEERFVSWVPEAASTPYEMWITPRRHAPDFGTMDPGEVGEFSLMLRDMLARLGRCLDDPAYNFSVAGRSSDQDGSEAFHWIMRLRPKATMPGGFELATGMAVNPSLPERDAAALRAAGDGP